MMDMINFFTFLNYLSFFIQYLKNIIENNDDININNVPITTRIYLHPKIISLDVDQELDLIGFVNTNAIRSPFITPIKEIIDPIINNSIIKLITFIDLFIFIGFLFNFLINIYKPPLIFYRPNTYESY